MRTNDTPASRLATRLSFFAAGFGAACWAPLVPFARTRLGVDDAGLGLLLLCLGIGSVLVMPLAGGLVARFGSRRVILAAGAGLLVALPALGIASHAGVMAATLLLFGASLGAMDVAMNIHAVAVERAAPLPLMSGFHGLFSLGGFAGAGTLAVLLTTGVPVPAAAAAGAAVVALALLGAAPRYIETREGGTAPFLVRPRGIVLLLGALAFVAFLVEGAILDWSALLLARHHAFDPAHGGVAYALFSVAMAAGRLTGDRAVARLGSRRVLVLGGLLTAIGLVAVLPDLHDMLTLAGFVLTGLGAANLVPVLFTQAGRQTVMPTGLAIAAVAAIGYAGILAGPALMGFVADAAGLRTAFVMLAVMMLAVPLSAGVVLGRHGRRHA